MTIGSIFRPLLELCAETGTDVGAILREEGLTEATLVDPETRLPTLRSRALAKRIFTALGDPEAGLRAGERFRVEDADLLGYVARHSESALEALEAFPRFARLIGDSASCTVTLSAHTAELAFGLTGGRTLLPEAVDYAVVVVARAARAVTSGKAMLLEARLARPEPKRREPYRRALCADVSFDAEESVLVFSRAELEARFDDRNPRLQAILTKRAEEVLSQLPEALTLAAQVRASVARRLTDGAFDAPSVARDLGMSERTLRRRLQDSGETYRALVDAVRAERAVSLADEGKHSVTAIAELCGFADGTAFARAFRRWTGAAPNEYRRSETKPDSDVAARARKSGRPGRTPSHGLR
ncbi:MAG TPA: AraC family transcriptional regulator ligand-binding domain-containing protein [Polyangiaceae bacterium]|jgi:AraC-like DNA-binding protein|nr:AraC family transcriptional regulator ligand-binding domain-containing protein [Polyangiaceae bacterium]